MKKNGGHLPFGKRWTNTADDYDYLQNSTGCAYRISGKDLYIATYGEYQYVDGGYKVKLDIQVPKNKAVVFCDNLIFSDKDTPFDREKNYGWMVSNKTPTSFLCTEIKGDNDGDSGQLEETSVNPVELIEWKKCISTPTIMKDIRELDN